MVAFTYRMPAFVAPGEVNRAHPASIEPTLMNAAAPPTAYGQAVVIDATSHAVRPVVAGDTALTDVYGITVRPYPFQAFSASSYGAAPFGGATPPTTGEIDVLRSGYISASVVGSPVKGGQVFIWITATSAPHIQGGFEAVAGGVNTIALTSTKTTFNGAPDASGLTEIAYNV